MYQKAYEVAENKNRCNGQVEEVEEKIPRTRPKEGKREEEKEDKFSIHSCLQDLTLEAEIGRFGAVLGRDKEIQQIQQILACQVKKNVLIIGDPGVGKSALVEELAYRIVSGQSIPISGQASDPRQHGRVAGGREIPGPV